MRTKEKFLISSNQIGWFIITFLSRISPLFFGKVVLYTMHDPTTGRLKGLQAEKMLESPDA